MYLRHQVKNLNFDLLAHQQVHHLVSLIITSVCFTLSFNNTIIKLTWFTEHAFIDLFFFACAYIRAWRKYILLFASSFQTLHIVKMMP